MAQYCVSSHLLAQYCVLSHTLAQYCVLSYTLAQYSAVTHNNSVFSAVKSTGLVPCAAAATHSILRAVDLPLYPGRKTHRCKEEKTVSYVLLFNLFTEGERHSACCSPTHLLHGLPIKFMTVGKYFLESSKLDCHTSRN
jgi:hypothetical protein